MLNNKHAFLLLWRFLVEAENVGEYALLLFLSSVNRGRRADKEEITNDKQA